MHKQIIPDSIRLAREGLHPRLVARLNSGWLVLADKQILLGYCLLLADPPSSSLNELSEKDSIQFFLDMRNVGEKLSTLLNASRINYEILGNANPFLHAHIIPRYSREPYPFKNLPIWYYDVANSTTDLAPDELSIVLKRLRDAFS